MRTLFVALLLLAGCTASPRYEVYDEGAKSAALMTPAGEMAGGRIDNGTRVELIDPPPKAGKLWLVRPIEGPYRGEPIRLLRPFVREVPR